MADFAFMPAVVRWVSTPAEASVPGVSHSQFKRDVTHSNEAAVERVLADYVSRLVGHVRTSGQSSELAPRFGALQAAADDLLSDQTDLREKVAGVVGAAGAQQALLAQETLRRLLVEIVATVTTRTSQAESTLISAFARSIQPTSDFLASTVARLALLVVALRHVAEIRADAPNFVAVLASKAFQTGQTLRGTVKALGLDLVPWKELPELRSQRLGEAARLLWEPLDQDSRDRVANAWNQRTSIRSP